MDIPQALHQLAPGAEWTINADDYDQITWLSPDIPKPTREQIEAKIEELRALEPMRRLRVHRDKLLAETDWISGEDVPQSLKDKWYPYRQALRDLPETSTPVIDPSSPTGISGVDWPVKPE